LPRQPDSAIALWLTGCQDLLQALQLIRCNG
jgi:hypothetical protein